MSAELEEQASRLRNNGNGAEAAKLYQKAAESYEAEGDLLRAAGCLHMVGVSYKVDNEISKAIRELKAAAKRYGELHEVVREGSAFRDIGICYSYDEKNEEALKWLLKAQGLQGADKAELGITEAKIGLVHLKLGNSEEAERHINKGLTLIRSTDQWFYEVTALMHLADLYQQTNRPAKATSCLRDGIEIIKMHDAEGGQGRRLAQLYGLLAWSQLSSGEVDQAKESHRKAESLIKEMNPRAADVVRRDIKSNDLAAKLDLQRNANQ